MAHIPLKRLTLLLTTLALGATVLAVSTTPVSALSFDPLRYYSFDYHIVFSQAEVEPGESFDISIGADVECVQDTPIGADEVSVEVEIEAIHLATGHEALLVDGYSVTISDPPDWKGDTYSLDETVSMSLPEDSIAGDYAIVLRLTRVQLDGWNVTGLIPSSSRTKELGTIACTTYEEPPMPPESAPGQLSIDVLGHLFTPDIGADGELLAGLAIDRIEGQVSLTIEEGTRCLDVEGEALDYVAVSRAQSPRPYEEGVVLSAYNFYPAGARFAPPVVVGIVYDRDGLPAGVAEEDLMLAWWDREEGEWVPFNSAVEEENTTVTAPALHFSTIGLLAATASSGPAVFAEEGLLLQPREVSSMQPVRISVTISNTGGSNGTYPLELTVNDYAEHEVDLELSPGQSRTVLFEVARTTPGAYQVAVGGLTDTFTVLRAPTSNDENEKATGDEPAAVPSSGTEDKGMNPAYAVLLALAGVAFITLVILVLAGVL